MSLLRKQFHPFFCFTFFSKVTWHFPGLHMAVAVGPGLDIFLSFPTKTYSILLLTSSIVFLLSLILCAGIFLPCSHFAASASHCLSHCAARAFQAVAVCISPNRPKLVRGFLTGVAGRQLAGIPAPGWPGLDQAQ